MRVPPAESNAEREFRAGYEAALTEVLTFLNEEGAFDDPSDGTIASAVSRLAMKSEVVDELLEQYLLRASNLAYGAWMNRAGTPL